MSRVCFMINYLYLWNMNLACLSVRTSFPKPTKVSFSWNFGSWPNLGQLKTWQSLFFEILILRGVPIWSSVKIRRLVSTLIIAIWKLRFMKIWLWAYFFEPWHVTYHFIVFYPLLTFWGLGGNIRSLVLNYPVSFVPGSVRCNSALCFLSIKWVAIWSSF